MTNQDKLKEYCLCSGREPFEVFCEFEDLKDKINHERRLKDKIRASNLASAQVMARAFACDPKNKVDEYMQSQNMVHLTLDKYEKLMSKMDALKNENANLNKNASISRVLREKCEASKSKVTLTIDGYKYEITKEDV